MPKHVWFGLFPLRSPLLRELLLFSFPPGTKMFQFSGLAPTLACGDMSSTYRVAPFGHLRINGYLHLPEAFRSLSRPSSPLRAKASSVCSSLLSLNFLSFFLQNHLPICQRSSCSKLCRGEYRSRTDDPLLAKQVL